MDLKKLFGDDQPVWKFTPQPDITAQELAIILAAVIDELKAFKASPNNEGFKLLQRHFTRIEG